MQRKVVKASELQKIYVVRKGEKKGNLKVDMV